LLNEIEPKPLNLEVIASGIPQELKDQAQWVCWKLNRGEKRWEKIPIDPKTGRFASTTNPSSWGTFDQAWVYYENHQGRGVDSFVGIDLDKCRDPETGEIAPWALEIVEKMDSFTELSPSGEGLHIFVRGELPGDGMNTKEIEMYDCKRYFTVTGQAYDAA
jgi:putative DNA primase/helicase